MKQPQQPQKPRKKQPAKAKPSAAKADNRKTMTREKNYNNSYNLKDTLPFPSSSSCASFPLLPIFFSSSSPNCD
jgi:hypothetical protein